MSSYGRRSSWLVLACLLTVIGIASVFWFWPSAGSPQARVEMLSKRVIALIESKSYPEALKACEELIALEPTIEQYQYWRAISQSALGQNAESIAAMRQLAQGRYEPAALWLLQSQFDLRKVQSWSDEDHQLFQELVTTASRSQTTSTPARLCHARYFVAMTRFDEALVIYSDMVQKHPDIACDAAALSMRQGNTKRALQYAELATEHFESRLDENANDEEARLQLVRALLMLDRQEESMDVLKAGFERSGQPAFQQAAAEVMVSWARRIARKHGKPDSFLSRVELIQHASQCAPHDALMLSAYVDLIEEAMSNKERLRVEMVAALAKGQYSDSMHVMLGLLDLIDTTYERAALHFDLVHGGSAYLPLILNNLAIIVSDRDPPDLVYAVSLSNAAFRRLPEEDRFRQTRERLMKQLELKLTSTSSAVDASVTSR